MSCEYICSQCGKKGNHPMFHKSGKKIGCEFCGQWTEVKDIELKIET